MAFSFRKLFGKQPPEETDSAEATPPPNPPSAKEQVSPPAPQPGTGSTTPSSQPKGPSKTVKPRSVKTFNLREASQKLSQVRPQERPSKPPISLSGVQLKPQGMEAAAQAAQSKDSDGSSAPDVTVTLAFSDVAPKIPEEYVSPDAGQNPELTFSVEAREFFDGLTRGKATLPVNRIAQLCPEGFQTPPAEDDSTPIPLPLHKLVEQLGTLQTRPDQVADEEIPEIETPFSKVAREDDSNQQQSEPKPATEESTSEQTPSPEEDDTQSVKPPQLPRIDKGITQGKPTPILPSRGKRPATVRASVAGSALRLKQSQESAKPPIGGSPAPGDAEADTTFVGHTATVRSIPKISLPKKPVSKEGEESKPADPGKQKKLTARISVPPLSLKPKLVEEEAEEPRETETPDSASIESAPPPSQPLPKPPIPLKLAKESDTAGKPATEPEPHASETSPASAEEAVESETGSSDEALTPAEGQEHEAPPSTEDGPGAGLLRLRLQPILLSFPDHLVEGNREKIQRAQSEHVDLPMELILPQLSKGRVSIPLETFQQALPESFRRIFEGNDPSAEVPLPLQEVLENLPADALALREDQEEVKITEEFPTPFSDKAREDAERMAQEKEAAPASDHQSTEAEPEESSSTDLKEAEPEPPQETSLPKPPIALKKDETETPPPAEPTTQAATDEEVKPEETAEEAEAPPAALPKPPISLPKPSLPTAPVEQPDASEEEPEPVADLEEPPSTPGTSMEQETEPQPSQPTQSGESASAPGTAAVAIDEEWDSTRLQSVFMTDEQLDSRKVVQLANQLPGIETCMVMFSDGLKLAGDFPADLNPEGFCAIAPHFYKRVEGYACDLSLDRPETVTLHTSKAQVSFFLEGDICVAVLHKKRGFLPGVREKFQIIAEELSKMYQDKPGSSESKS